jgi:methyl-accepting chemotaxis protein
MRPPNQLPALLATEAKLHDKIEDNLDILVEGAKEEGFNFHEDSTAVGRSSHWTLVGASALTAAAGIVIALLIGRSIGRPIVAITRIMSTLAGGDTEVVIPAIKRRDEIGTMARAVEVFKQNAIAASQLNSADVQEQAEKKNRRQLSMDRHTQDFGSSISGVMALLVKAADAMRVVAGEMSEAALETRDSASGAVDGANASALNLNSIAAAAEEMAASVTGSARRWHS